MMKKSMQKIKLTAWGCIMALMLDSSFRLRHTGFRAQRV